MWAVRKIGLRWNGLRVDLFCDKWMFSLDYIRHNRE